MKQIPLLLLLTLALATACKKKPTAPAALLSSTADKTTAAPTAVADSSIYGEATDDFGMSTFALKTDQGEELHLERTQKDGTDAQFIGNVQPGDRYALLLADHGTSVECAINLSQLAQFVAPVRVWNGRLILPTSTTPDTAEIIRLDADSLVAQGRDIHRFARKK